MFLSVVVGLFHLALLHTVLTGCSLMKKTPNNTSSQMSGKTPHGAPPSRSQRKQKDSSTSSRKPVQKEESQTSQVEAPQSQFKFGGLDVPDDDDEPKTNLMSLEDADNPLMRPEVRGKLRNGFPNKGVVSQEKKGLATEATIETTMMPVEIREDRTQEDDWNSQKSKKRNMTSGEVTVELNRQYLKGPKHYVSQKKAAAAAPVKPVRPSSGEKPAFPKGKKKSADVENDAQQTQTNAETSNRENKQVLEAQTQSAIVMKKPFSKERGGSKEATKRQLQTDATVNVSRYC